MSQISNLFRLQQIDSQIDTANNQFDAIVKALSDNTAINAIEQAISQAGEYHLQISKKVRDAENKSYDTRIKIELSEKSLYGGKIQNPKELQDLQNEIASLKRLMISLEDKELEAMMELEEAESKLSQAKDELRELEIKQIEQHAQLNGEKTRLQNLLGRLDAERKAMIPTIPAPDLGLYEQLRKNRSGVAVVKIASRACSACGTTLTAALVQATQSPGQIIRCPTCGRILYSG